MAAVTLDNLSELYENNERCAELIGLHYLNDDAPGYTRQKAGKGFRYFDQKNRPITDQSLKDYSNGLVIPPAWQEVWICPNPDGHILATGVDEKGRKQYIYHPKWRSIRDMLNFYQLIQFGEDLPKIRKVIEEQLRRHNLDKEQVLAVMVWFVDHSYIRIGNETYYEENESIGLTTLNKKNVTVKGDTITLIFRGKSGKDQHLEMSDSHIAFLVKKLLAQPGPRLFKTSDGQVVAAADVNAFLQEITGAHVSAKNFRTWGGTLAAFRYLKHQRKSDEKPEKVVVEAVDKAAEELGNTRSVARAHYVHPHILETYTQATFDDYLKRIKPRRRAYLDTSETELLDLLELLFKREFDLLSIKQVQ